MDQMELIRKRRNGYALLLAASICLAVWLGVTIMSEVVFIFGIISVISILLLVRESRLLYDATLIRDNRILTVPSALITISGRKIKKDSLETVVSTFGILIGSKIYRWGIDGVHGVRLQAARIDKECLVLTFGDSSGAIRVELQHGITQKQLILDTMQKLLCETGVAADIIGW